MKILIASVGSGGHIFPAVALARELEKEKAEIVFVASKRGLDRKILAGESFRKIYISANPMPYKPGLKMVPFFFRLLHDGIHAFFMLLMERPRVVVGFGGYTSGAVLLAGSFLRMKTVIHEQNVVPGRTNRLLAGFADSIAVSFDETKRYFRNRNTVFTGNPLRRKSLEECRESSLEKFGLEAKKFTVLIMGGSQGARSLNNIASRGMGILPEEAKKNIQIVHIAGPGASAGLSDYYREKGIEGRVFGFVDEINAAYSVSDMAISRSGAAAIFELAAFAKPMVLVPYPGEKNNQRFNAMFFANKNAAVYRDERNTGETELRDLVMRLFKDPLERKRLSENAKRLSVTNGAERLKQVIMEIYAKDA